MHEVGSRASVTYFVDGPLAATAAHARAVDAEPLLGLVPQAARRAEGSLGTSTRPRSERDLLQREHESTRPNSEHESLQDERACIHAAEAEE